MLEKRCRLCAERRDDLIGLLEEVDLSEKINSLFQIQVEPADKLPTCVCILCRDTVNNIWEFNKRVQKAQAILCDFDEEEEEDDDDDDLLQMSSITENDCMYQGNAQTNHTKRIFSNRRKSPISKVRNQQQEKVKKEDTELVLPGLTDAKTNEDGSVEVGNSLTGWDQYPWKCSDCQQLFNKVDDLKYHHIAIHEQNVKFACADCPKVYAKYTTFIGHVKVHRPDLKFCCDICGKWFPSSKAQDDHHVTHEDEKPHCCATCGKRFRMHSALMVHSRSHLPAEQKTYYQCDECPKRFGTKPNLMAHKRIHAGVREYTCDQCGKSFVQKGNLDNHLLTHNSARPFQCSTCGKTFKTLVRLKKHGFIHSGLKPYQCDVCGRQFRERGTLKEHHRIHTGAMPFTCEFCGKSFRFKGVLTTHRRLHTGERPYSCHECQHHFTNWPNYNKHMKRRHGINTSVTVRKPQTIPPTGMPQKNPPGTILAPPQPITLTETFKEQPTPQPTFYPVLNLYNLSEEHCYIK